MNENEPDLNYNRILAISVIIVSLTLVGLAVYTVVSFPRKTAASIEPAPLYALTAPAEQQEELADPAPSAVPPSDTPKYTPVTADTGIESKDGEESKPTQEAETEIPQILAEEPNISSEDNLKSYQQSLSATVTSLMAPAHYDIPLSDEMQDYIYSVCAGSGIAEHYELILALMYCESGYRSGVISKTSDYGLMQINQCNHAWLRRELGVTDFLDPYQNVIAGVYIIAPLLLESDAHKALMAYNEGFVAAKRRWDDGVTSTAYSRAVIATRDKLMEAGTISE